MKQIILAAALSAATALPALAERIPLSDLSGYINGIRRAQAEFTQISDDGAIATGTLYMHRPGRMRFEYAGDEQLLVIAGGGQVAIFDGRANTAPEQYPLRRTPLNLILARNVDLSRSGMIIAHEDDGTSTRVVAQDPDDPEIGQIEMVFTDDPIELRQWIITDANGYETTVILGDMQEGISTPSRYFNIPAEMRARGLSE
ncbi:MAG: cell envelope biogenesis protein LolA [Nioella sp.]|jgi:outer membrane lipoprotein-sorting protein|nr:cell envelope biogenesis protein LolA [Nioella sp.]|tara:strand:- start:249 stop:851 length:603 start_codon:yes stop_codon:yes gene_type:complete